MDTNKEVFMYGAIALDKITRDFMDFINPASREYLYDRIMKASTIDGDEYRDIVQAADRMLAIMKHIEENGTGDVAGHRLRQKRMAEIKSIMHIARSYPSAAIKRLKELPSKNLVNA